MRLQAFRFYRRPLQINTELSDEAQRVWAEAVLREMPWQRGLPGFPR